MADQPELIYLEPDDEITSVVRRLRAAESGTVVIVAPGRSRATSSAVALRLLAQVAAEEARSVSLVADAPTRAVATEAGIPAFASVAEATSGSALPDQAAATPRAPIHVVRGVSEAAGLSSVPAPAAARSGAGDETVTVRLPASTTGGGSGGSKGRRRLIPRWPWLTGLLILAVIVSAALLPGATVSITPATQAVGPKTYQLQLPVAGQQSADTQLMRPGTATGTRLEQVSATGAVTFANWNTAASVAVPQGTSVSVGGVVAFVTNQRIVVLAATFSGTNTVPSHGSVGITAVVPGLSGNVAAADIDTVDDRLVRGFLKSSPSNKNRLVTNPEATVGGAETPHTVIQQSDVDAVVAGLQADLASHLADVLAGQPGLLYSGPPADEVPQINVPAGLVGTEDQATFQLTGTLAFNRPYVMRTDVQAAARDALAADPQAAPEGTTVLTDSIQVEMGTVTVNGDQMTIAVTLRAAAAAAIDEVAVQDKVAGKTVGEAKAALADQGDVQIKLFPDWLDRLPRIPFRITVLTVLPRDTTSPSP
jgi:hypothetical protein